MTIDYKLVLQKILVVLSKPRYLMLFLAAWIVILGLLLWLFAIDTLLYVLTLPDYAGSEKLRFFISPYVNSFSFFFQDPTTAARMIFSVLAGIGVAVFVYVRNRTLSVTLQKRKGFGGFAVALLGSGCIACGTSIISPLLIGTGAGSSALLGAAIGTIGYLIGIVLILIAIIGFAERIPATSTKITN